MSEPTADTDDYAYLGPDRPASSQLADPRSGPGRLTPLPLKLDAVNQGVPLAFSMLAVSVAVVGLSPVPADAHSATCQVQGAAIRYTVDGTPPTSTVGFRADPGAILTFGMQETLRGVQAVREGGVDATLAVIYWS